ncbi:MAG: dihydroorotase [Schleiferilactobacillus harbinensis]|nr:dihydroorotase [Schleiferilactobacillus harbinensis]
MLIKNAHVVGPETFNGDIRIHQGIITTIGQDLSVSPDETVLDASGQTVLPGLVDVHVHFRDPGQTDKETISTGSRAAAHGGFTSVVAMPNVTPVPDNIADLKALLTKNAQDGVVHVHQYAPITTALRSNQLVDFERFNQLGVFGFSNDGVGVQQAATMKAAMAACAAVDAPLAAHIEDESLRGDGVMNAGPVAKGLGLPGMSNQTESSQLARDLDLAAATGVHYHACHISTRQSVALIRQAKAAGVHVTAEVTPHHLLLEDTDIIGDDPNFKMNPPLRSHADRLAVIGGLLDGTLDMVATDHAPHTIADKGGTMKTAAFGIVGLETAFAILYSRFVRSGRMTLLELVDKMSTTPATAFKLPAGHIQIGAPADLTVMNLETPYQINPNTWFSKGVNSPFIGETVYGQTVATIVSGKIVYQQKEGR